MISLKKYLDMDVDARQSVDTGRSQLLRAALECYRSALLAISKNGSHACPGFTSQMPHRIAQLSNQLLMDVTPQLVVQTEKQVEEELQQWSDQSSDYFKGKANEVKELLIVLARTAQSVGERDQRYAGQLSEFTTRLQTIANLEDLTQVRASLVKGAAELKTHVDQMVQDSQKSVAQLRAEVTNYESKLKAVEQLALRDALTGLANRRSVEECIQRQIDHQQGFCILILDLNGFKPVNDTYGHLAGDNLLKQFSQELRSNVRSGDVVGRWGGDEFMVVLECDLAGVHSQIERINKWVFGKYTLQLGADTGEVKVNVSAAIGAAQWRPGQTMQHLIETADAAMYKEKQLSKQARA